MIFHVVISMDEEGFVEYLPVNSRCCRVDLYVAKTRLRMSNGGLYDFWGLFCHNDIEKGDFIGMYSGIWIHSDGAFSFGNRYAIEVASSLLVAPPGQRPDPQEYPIAMANEPAPGTIANATLREWVFDRQDVAQIPENVHDHMFHGVGLLACEFIPHDTEIRWFYGAAYSGIRNYPVGDGCDVVSDIHPCKALGRQLPFDAVSPTLGSPSSSDNEDSDPTYRGYRNSSNAGFTQMSRDLLLFMCLPGKDAAVQSCEGNQRRVAATGD
mmetsp:Transcript_19137/g.27798  ORF Transcript_19137/g.27798 Transcript_19137/m.27798 type:complete len:267 (+) Transcript_19137:3515-4315(+)